MKQALLVARGRGGPAALTVRDALRLGTRGGAAVLGRDDLGSLEPGKRADLAVWRTDGLELGGRGRSGRRPRALGAAPRRPALRRRRGGRPRRPRSCAPTRRRSPGTIGPRREDSPHDLDPRPRHRARPARGRHAGRPLPRPGARLTAGDRRGRAHRASSRRRSSRASTGSSSTSEAAFFEKVELTIAIADVHRHYHVPLLVSSYQCTTYRGS